jgi:lipopolysaccharide transport system ATP-binding protein
MNGTILGMRKHEIARKFDEIVDFAGVAKYIDTPVKRYSSGMMVRLGFAVAAFLEPEILIVDEVLAVGDAEFQKKAIGKMQDVSKGEGRTVLFVSHNMASMQNLCHKGILMANGSVKMSGSIDDVINFYLNDQFGNLKTELEDRKDRQGSGILKFKRVWLENSRKERINSLYSGLDCFVCIEIENTTSNRLEDVVISVGIDDSQGKRLTIFSNDLTNQPIAVDPGASPVVRIKVDSFPLQSDSYYFTLFTKVKGEIADWIMNAGRIEVENGDYFNSGRIIQKGQGSLLINHEFIV